MALLALLFGGCGEAPPPQDLEARRKAIQEATRALVGDLERAGRYDCCIEHPCNLCATRAGGCRCGEALQKGEPVCEECALMWHEGHGAEPGVDPATVRSYLEAGRERERKAAGQTCACGDER